MTSFDPFRDAGDPEPTPIVFTLSEETDLGGYFATAGVASLAASGDPISATASQFNSDMSADDVPIPAGYTLMLQVGSSDGGNRMLRYAAKESQISVARYGPNDALRVGVIARGLFVAEGILEGIAASIPLRMPSDDTVPVRFWSHSATRGAQCRVRSLNVLGWDSVADNYPLRTRGALSQLVAFEDGPTNGSLILLHGPPGTGKTYAIRALGEAWSDWCEMNYVVDPEKFFGNGEYMLSVLVDEYERGGSKWRLIVVEDMDEIIRMDAHKESGQAMSRLLNVCDGLIGQGLRLIVLLTTNEEVSKLHPAIIRPGRCLANIEAGKFNAEEATRWAHAHAVELNDGLSGERTLAELYTGLADHDAVIESSPRTATGFRAA